jgi:hypothetical protein
MLPAQRGRQAGRKGMLHNVCVCKRKLGSNTQAAGTQPPGEPAGAAAPAYSPGGGGGGSGRTRVVVGVDKHAGGGAPRLAQLAGPPAAGGGGREWWGENSQAAAAAPAVQVAVAGGMCAARAHLVSTAAASATSVAVACTAAMPLLLTRRPALQKAVTTPRCAAREVRGRALCMITRWLRNAPGPWCCWWSDCSWRLAQNLRSTGRVGTGQPSSCWIGLICIGHPVAGSQATPHTLFQTCA